MTRSGGFKVTRRTGGSWLFDVPYRGADLLAHPMANKGSAFSDEERRAFDLVGLLPFANSTLELQAKRAYGHIAVKDDPLERYIGLAALQDRNEHLYYRVLLDHLEELLPIVYTPTVGQASKRYSEIFRRGRGVWITPAHRGHVKRVLGHAPVDDVRLIVVTDNQAILGIGDQGAGGMVIPIGKLAIYSAAAGIHPARTLPVSLDVGTDNRKLLDDELYLGWPETRLRGEPYQELVAEFVQAVRELWPQALVQWEDFQKKNAFDLLEHYRGAILSFNDDIQGTGATALAGLMAACRIAGTELAEQRVAIVGGGAAGIGIANQLRAAGVGGGERPAVLDSSGLIVDDRDLDDFKTRLAWSAERARAAGLGSERDLHAVVRRFRPTLLIGTSGQPGLFDEELVREMAHHVERPIVFPFSNPTDNAEATPEDLIRWTEGRALVATGSPFAPVVWDGHERRIGQGNNAFIFPGVGLGALVGRARAVTDGMFTAAARALAHEVTDDELAREQLYPSVSRLRQVTRAIALAVARQARDEGVSRKLPDASLARAVDEQMWEPVYPELRAV